MAIDPGYSYSNATGSQQSALYISPNKNSVLVTSSESPYIISGSVGCNNILLSGSAVGTVTLSSGGVVALQTLSTGVLYPFSATQVSASAGGVYILY
jgi:hypothetical protein